MTKDRDAQIIAETYQTILNENSILNYIDSLDPETLNIIAHTLAMGAGIGLARLKSIIDQKKEEKSSSDANTAKIGPRLPQKINPDGSAADPHEMGHGISSNLRNDAMSLKGKKM
jgi:hypothetical protein